MVVRVEGAPTQAAPRDPYLQHEDLRVERQPHPCQLLVLLLGVAGAAAGAAAATTITTATTTSTTFACRRRRQRHLEHARLLHHALAPRLHAPHRVGCCELVPAAARGGGAEDVGRAVEEVEDALHDGHADEGAGCLGGLALVCVDRGHGGRSIDRRGVADGCHHVAETAFDAALADTADTCATAPRRPAPPRTRARGGRAALPPRSPRAAPPWMARRG